MVFCWLTGHSCSLLDNARCLSFDNYRCRVLRQEIDSREYFAEVRFAESYGRAAVLQPFADKRGRLVAQCGQTESERRRQSVWAEFKTSGDLGGKYDPKQVLNQFTELNGAVGN